MSNDKEEGLKFYKDLSLDKSQNDDEIKKVYHDWAGQYDNDNDDLLGTVSQPNSVDLLNNHINDKNLKIVDLTGAGDLFAAGFLHGYINKLSTKHCLVKGTEMSSRVIQQIGARL